MSVGYFIFIMLGKQSLAPGVASEKFFRIAPPLPPESRAGLNFPSVIRKSAPVYNFRLDDETPFTTKTICLHPFTAVLAIQQTGNFEIEKQC